MTIYIYVCMHACMHACMYACMHVYMYVCMRVCMYVCETMRNIPETEGKCRKLLSQPSGIRSKCREVHDCFVYITKTLSTCTLTRYLVNKWR